MPTNHSSLIDEGSKFQIIPASHKVVVPQSHKVIGTVGAHNSEKITFQCPKTIDGHDIANCTDKYISWTNAAGNDGSYNITEIETDDENVYFAWVIDNGVTASAGGVVFSVHFEDITERGELLYKWGTTECKDCSILSTQTTRGNYAPVPDGYVPAPSGSVTITANGTHDVAAFKTAVVAVAGGAEIPEGYVKPSGTVNITANGTHNVRNAELVTVNVNNNLQEKTVTENGEITPDAGFDGLSKVIVNIPECTHTVYGGMVTIV